MKTAIVAIYVSYIMMLGLMEQDGKSASIERGKAVYTEYCVSCHLANGEGVQGVFPPLANSDYLNHKREESIRAVKFGQKGEITVNGVKYKGMMPSPRLETNEIADVMNYICNSWGNKTKKMITEKEVLAIK